MLFRSGPNKKEQIVRLANDGHVVGHCAFGGETYPVSAIALEDTRACFLVNDVLVKAYLENPSFTLAFMTYYSTELRKLEMRLKHIAQMNIHEKVAESILYLYDIFGADPETQLLNVHLSRQELADLVGTNAEQVTRQLTLFNEEKLIEKEGKDLKITDPVALRRIIEKYH